MYAIKQPLLLCVLCGSTSLLPNIETGIRTYKTAVEIVEGKRSYHPPRNTILTADLVLFV
jgi:hypothetical protein